MSITAKINLQGRPNQDVKVIERRRDDLEATVFFEGALGSSGRASLFVPKRDAVILGQGIDVQSVQYENKFRHIQEIDFDEKTITLHNT